MSCNDLALWQSLTVYYKQVNYPAILVMQNSVQRRQNKSMIKSNRRKVCRANRALQKKDWICMQEKWVESGGLVACHQQDLPNAILFIMSENRPATIQNESTFTISHCTKKEKNTRAVHGNVP